MLSRGALALSLILCVTGIARAQETVAVFEFEGIGLSQPEADAATQVFRAELGATGSFTVMPRADVQSKLAAQGIENPVCRAVGCAAEYGQLAGVKGTIVGTLTMLGNRITGEVRLVDVAKKEVTFSDRFTAANLDDLEATLKRLAAAVASRRQIQSEVGRFPVTQDEKEEPARKSSYMTAGMGFGTGWPLGDSYANISSLSQFLFITRYEAGQFVLESSIGFQWGSAGERDTVNSDYYGGKDIVHPTDVNVLPIDIGVRYVFNRKAEFSPFVGGGIGMHFVTVTTKPPDDVELTRSGTAFAYSLAAGVYGFQSYDFHLSLEARYSMMFTDAISDDQSFHHQMGWVLALTHKLERKQGHRSGCGPRLFPWQ